MQVSKASSIELEKKIIEKALDANNFAILI